MNLTSRIRTLISELRDNRDRKNVFKNPQTFQDQYSVEFVNPDKVKEYFSLGRTRIISKPNFSYGNDFSDVVISVGGSPLSMTSHYVAEKVRKSGSGLICRG